jgi:hypothetical protein
MWGRGSKAPFILNLDTSGQIHAPLLNVQTARWDLATVCKFWSNIKNYLSLPGIETRFLDWPNSNAVAVPNLLSRLLLCLEGTETKCSNRFAPTKIYLWDK